MKKDNDKKQNVALSGGYAIGEALRQINPDVMAVYPITPQTPIIASFSKMIADGRADTEMIEVESEHSAMSACIGASAAGARTMTASKFLGYYVYDGSYSSGGGDAIAYCDDGG